MASWFTIFDHTYSFPISNAHITVNIGPWGPIEYNMGSRKGKTQKVVFLRLLFP